MKVTLVKSLSATLLVSILFFGNGLDHLFAQGVADEVETKRIILQAELTKIEYEIEQEKVKLQGTQKESISLKRDLTILNSNINKTQLEIKARNLTIADLIEDINYREYTLNQLTEKMDREKESLAQLIRKTNEVENSTLVEVMLSSDNLSDFFLDVDNFAAVKLSLNQSFVYIKSIRQDTKDEKNILEGQKSREVDLRYDQISEKDSLERSEDEKEYILYVTKGEEDAYKQVIKDKEKNAAQIRATLFALRDSSAIPFWQALEFAQHAEQMTGVRAAFILAILTQESNLGENVGQCYLKDTVTGDGVGKNTGRYFDGVMKPSRDVQPFLGIAKRLGFDPFNTPVSCPQGVGYGGAMGPSQFIPSTWVMYEGKVAEATGHNPPNPWEPEDAFMATSLFMRDLGAYRGGYSAEREAAARYYAGGYWEKNGLGYAASVLAHATRIQTEMIDPLY